MSDHLLKKSEEISKAIEERGVRGVEVSADGHDPSIYLDGDVRNATEEAIAVEAAIEAGAERVVDNLEYPGAEHHVAHVSGEIHAHTGNPVLDILRGANLGGRVFDATQTPPVRTGTPID